MIKNFSQFAVLIILFFLIHSVAKSQNSLEYFSDSVIVKGSKFIYRGENYNYYEMREDVFSKNNNPRFKYLLQRKDKTNICYGVSFVGIPTTMVGVFTIILGFVSPPYAVSHGPDKQLINTGSAITFVGLVNVGINIYTFKKGRRLNKEIASMYNSMYR